MLIRLTEYHYVDPTTIAEVDFGTLYGEPYLQFFYRQVTRTHTAFSGDEATEAFQNWQTWHKDEKGSG
jgi:hypothetical protein